jgi:hypothetical protein
METIEVMLLPAPRKIMAKEAPKAAALDIPKVNGEARGLRRIHCITTPATAKPAPASKAPIILTKRMFQTTPPAPFISKVKMYLITSKKEMLIGPLWAAMITQKTSTSKPTMRKRRLRFTNPL